MEMVIATVILSFATVLGVSALVFNNVFGFPGADPAVPPMTRGEYRRTLGS